MPFFIPALAGGLLATRTLFSLGSLGRVASTFVRSPIIQGGSFGVGYTSGAYLGYGASNTLDPFSLHNKSYKPGKSYQFRLSYYGYGRRRYRRRYGRRRYYRYSGYRRYGRRSYRRSYY